MYYFGTFVSCSGFNYDILCAQIQDKVMYLLEIFIQKTYTALLAINYYPVVCKVTHLPLGRKLKHESSRFRSE